MNTIAWSCSYDSAFTSMLDTLKNRIHTNLSDVAWYQSSEVRDATMSRVLNWVVSEVDDKIYEYIKR